MTEQTSDPPSQRLKLSSTEEQQSDEEEETADKISHLPDALLTHILSLIPTKQSVKTAVLSKRWLPLWTSVPTLDFDDETPVVSSDSETGRREDHKTHHTTAFPDFVYSVLLHYEAKPVNRFRLRCSDLSDANITAWVGQAVLRKVQEIELSLSLSRYVGLPRKLFNCDSVVVMKLNGVFLNALVSFSVRLPQLKVLHVGDRVLFGCHDYIFALVAGCPVLEDLSLESSYNDACGGAVCLKGDVKLDMKLLEKAKIGFSWKNTCQKSMFLFFKALSNVRFLSIMKSTAGCLKHALASDIPVFNNLVQLEISFGYYYWDLLSMMLQNSRRLEALIIHKDPLKLAKGEEPQWNHEALPIPDCLLVHLKTFCLKEYQGWQSEMAFVGYIMQNARALETMTISIDSSLDLQSQLQIRRNLSILQRSFQSCEIVFC
ncbi:hypothetical protein RIF29_29493 [Crotalaria pallida]|uniref:FBD domain-containing protein n=1 Tax=Crotalaria pallida TaxID=3830 RepID=A0AAN9HXI6_CROPI